MVYRVHGYKGVLRIAHNNLWIKHVSTKQKYKKLNTTKYYQKMFLKPLSFGIQSISLAAIFKQIFDKKSLEQQQ